MTPYDKLAKFYDRYWTIEAPALFEHVLDSVLIPMLPEKGVVADLCCGTGQVAEMLAQRQFQVTGLDYSADMLAHARKNAPTATFIQADATSFVLDKPQDAIISLFDSINHLMSEDALLLCFKCVKNALKDDAPFFFDINDFDTFKDNWMAGFSAVEEDSACIMEAEFDEKTKVAKYVTTMFTPADNSALWEQHSSVVFEKYYPTNVVINILQNAGFHNIRIMEGEKDLKIDAFKGRIFFIAQ